MQIKIYSYDTSRYTVAATLPLRLFVFAPFASIVDSIRGNTKRTHRCVGSIAISINFYYALQRIANNNNQIDKNKQIVNKFATA